MAYYTALITEWATLPSSYTTAQKLTAVNSTTVASTTPIPCVLPTYTIYNTIKSTDYTALTTANQGYVNTILGMGTVDASPGTQVRGVISNIFAGTATLTALASLVAPYDAPPVSWWKSNGYTSPIGMSDLTAAGGLS